MRERGLGSKPVDYQSTKPELGIKGEKRFGLIQIIKFFVRQEKNEAIVMARLRGKDRPIFKED